MRERNYSNYFFLVLALHMFVLMGMNSGKLVKYGVYSKDYYYQKKSHFNLYLEFVESQEIGLTQSSVKKVLAPKYLEKKKRERKAAGNKLNNYFENLREYISYAQKYPSLGKKLKQEGLVLIELALNRRGHFKGIKIIKSSGSQILDNSAIENIKKLRQFSPPPVMPNGKLLFSQVPVRFRLK